MTREQAAAVLVRLSRDGVRNLADDEEREAALDEVLGGGWRPEVVHRTVEETRAALGALLDRR